MHSDHDPWQTGLAAGDVLAVSAGGPLMLADRQRDRLAALLPFFRAPSILPSVPRIAHPDRIPSL